MIMKSCILQYLERLMSPSASARRNSQTVMTPSSASTRRKRKRLPEVIEAAQNGTASPAFSTKRRSSVSDGYLSLSASFLDSTIGPDNQLLDGEMIFLLFFRLQSYSFLFMSPDNSVITSNFYIKL